MNFCAHCVFVFNSFDETATYEDTIGTNREDRAIVPMNPVKKLDHFTFKIVNDLC